MVGMICGKGGFEVKERMDDDDDDDDDDDSKSGKLAGPGVASHPHLQQ